MLCLVDNDPYGLNIYGVYKNGGDKGSVIERLRLALPELQFLGINYTDFNDEQRSSEGSLIELTDRDRRKIEIMLQKDWVRNEPKVVYFPSGCNLSKCGIEMDARIKWEKRDRSRL